jgi:dipeptidyl-peptidase-4
MRRPIALALTLLAPLTLRAQGAPPLDIDTLYSLPSLIGTAPRGVAWSSDSRTLAFLWNDEGTNFLDVWTADVAGGAPVRVTRMPRPVMPPPSTDHAALQARTRAEQDGGVSSVQWRPGKRELLLGFRGDLWSLVPGEAPVNLTRTPQGEGRAAYDPAGTRIAYVRDGDVWILALDVANAAPVRVTQLARDGVGVESFRWSADGARLAVVETDRTAIRTRNIPDVLLDEARMVPQRRAFPGEPSEKRRLGIVAATGGDVRWLDLGAEPMDVIHGYAWSPVRAELAIDKSDVFVKDRRIVLADAATGATTTLVREQEPGNVSAEWWIDWAPDGRRLFFTSDRADDYHVWRVAREGGAPVRVSRGAFAVFQASVLPRGGLAIVGNPGRAEERHLMIAAERTGGGTFQFTTRRGTHAPIVSPDGRWAADVFSSDSVPPDLYLHALDGAKGGDATGRRLTTSPRPAFAAYRWAIPEYVTFRNPVDGATLHARLILPPGFVRGTRVPLIVGSAYSNTVRNQWGGRTAHPLWGLDQVLVQRGYALLAVDVAGSSGHGTAFRRRIRLDYGGIDVEDLAAGVRWAVAQGIADSARVGIWGSSYGGLLTAKSLFTKPTLYRAGIAGAPATNVRHALTGEQRVMMRPQEQPAEYDRASARTYASGLQGSIMLLHGMRDNVVLWQDSAWLAQYLLQLGKDVEFLVLPDAGHGWDLEGLDQTRFAFKRMLDYFARHLPTGATR